MVNLRLRGEVEPEGGGGRCCGLERRGPRGSSRSLIVAGGYPGDHLIIVIVYTWQVALCSLLFV